MNAHSKEAVELLAPVIDRLRGEAQDEREVERAALLTKLAQVERAEATRAAEYGKARASLEATIAELETQLQAARHELNELAAPTGFTIEKLRGKLRRLADPRIGEALMQLSDLSDKARGAFVTGSYRVKKMLGYSVSATSNALPIADALAEIRQTRIELETLQEQQRPDDLDAVIAAKLNPIRLAVRNLHGFK